MRNFKKKKTIFVIILLSLCCIGIVLNNFISRPKRDVEEQVIAMTGMNIDISFDNATEIYGGIDSTYKSTPKKKLIVFVDSTSCSNCFISHLIEYYDVNDTLQSKNAELVVILHPKRERFEEVIARLENERYPFWCIVDAQGEFIRKNPNIPNNQLFHSFTIDKNNNVVIVGNPAKNDRIKALLLKELEN